MRIYTKKTTEFGSVLGYIENGVAISFTETPGNRHYEEYLEWVAEGNSPEVIEA